MKKTAAMLISAMVVFLLAGCGKITYPDLPDDAIRFEMGEYIDKDDDNAGYGTIEYDGRIYMPYGVLGKSLSEKDIDQCIGYLVMDENSSSVTDLSDKDTRVYTLTADREHHFLMEYDDTIELMNQHLFWRAVDTRGKSITIPGFIDSLEYSFWK